MKETKFNRLTKFNYKKTRKWQPNEWSGEYEKIVFESCLGAANTALATKYNFTKEHISNILNTEEARKIKADYVAAIRQGSLDLMEKQFGEMTTKSVDNMHKVINDPELLIKHPFSVFDRSVQVLKSVGKIQDDSKPGSITNNNTQINNTMIVTNEQDSKLLAGIDKLQQIKLLHGEVNGDNVN